MVLLHASCHNPTGADLSQDEWRAVLELVKRRSLLPFIDMAYQGLGEGPDADAFAIRLFSAELPELLCAVSCSKNFGLYRERTGALHVINQSTEAGDAALSQLVRLARGMWSMPPDHGAEIVRRILCDAALREAWAQELEAHARCASPGCATSWCASCARTARSATSASSPGSAACSPSSASAPSRCAALRAEHHIYMTDDSRINIAGLRAENLEYVAQATAQVLAA